MEPQPNNSSTSSNLAVRILSVVGGLLASICLILFLVLTSEISRSGVALSVIGSSFIAAALVGNRTISQLFLDTVITAFYVTGCIALCYAMADNRWNVHLICLVFLLIAVLTFLCSKGVFFPLLSVLLFNGALTWFIMESVEKIEISQMPVLLMGAIFLILNLCEARIITAHPAMKRLIRPLHTGFFLSFSCGLVWMSGIGYTFDHWVGVLSVFLWVGIALMLRQVMKVMKVDKPKTQVGVYLVCLALLIPTIFAPSLSGALLLLLVCFAYGYKLEVGASLVLLVYTIVKYYYELHLTLLMKSGTLFFTGVVLLFVWYFFTKHTRRHEEN